MDAFYSIYDQNGKYVGFTESLEEAKEMAAKYKGSYELEFTSPNSIFG